MQRLKRYVEWCLRRANLIGLADNLLLLRRVLTTQKINRRFLKAHREFAVPPYRLAWDAYNHINWERYYDKGIEHAEFIAQLVTEWLPTEQLSILEWGCGPARVIRHLRDCVGAERIELSGTDYNEQSIAWCRANLKDIDFRTNQLTPPLPFGPETFDCVYALSVFTHLSEPMQHAWMEELQRVLKPSGIIIFTVQGEIDRDRLLPGERARYEQGQLVVRDEFAEGKKRFLAIHSPRYVRNELVPQCQVLRHIPSPRRTGMLRQDVWVVARSDRVPSP